MTELLPLLEILAAADAEGIDALGIDPLAILAQAVTFLLLFFVVKKFALNKIVSILEQRRKTIESGVDLGLQLQEEKQLLDKKVEEVLHQARVGADKIIAEGHHEAGVIIKEAESEASRKADALLDDAHRKIEEDIKRARKSLEQDMLQLVSEATEAIIAEKVDAKKDASLIERVLRGAR